VLQSISFWPCFCCLICSWLLSCRNPFRILTTILLYLYFLSRVNLLNYIRIDMLNHLAAPPKVPIDDRPPLLAAQASVPRRRARHPCISCRASITRSPDKSHVSRCTPWSPFRRTSHTSRPASKVALAYSPSHQGRHVKSLQWSAV
jgi:hypothetical protein